MKTIILNSVVLLFCCFASSQTAIKSSMDSGGASTTTGNLQTLYTIGEVHVREVSVGPSSFSEGFINKGDLQIYSDFVPIPDPQFEQALLDQNIDTDGALDGQVPRSDIVGLTILNISGYDITSFEGLDSFTSLLTFSQINNQASVINPINFSGNLLLAQIEIINSPNLSQIDVSQNEFLQNLTVVTNNTLFNTIDVSNNLDLEIVNLSSNGLTSISLIDNPIITSLNVSNNPITELDVSFLSQLQTLEIYETQIEFLDVSSLFDMVSVLAYNGSLEAANFQNGGGNTDNVEFVDVSGNPSLECILVDSVAWAESPSGWIKDAKASYFENPSINFITFPGSQVVQSDGTGNQAEFNAWLASNGGAVVTTQCGSVNWTYDILASDVDVFNNSIEYLVEFSASTPYSGPDVTQAFFTIENVTEAGDDDGSGDNLCSVTSYDLSTLATVNLNAPNIDSYRFEQTEVFPPTPGVPDATFNDTIVDFPDTGAGSFTYTFKLIVEKSIDVFNPATGSYESRLFTDEARLTVNEVRIPFNPGPDQIKGWCPGTSLPTLAELFEEFEIIDGIEFDTGLFFTPENYWFDSVGNPVTAVTGPGVYVFNANDFLLECGAIPATVTVVDSTVLTLTDSSKDLDVLYDPLGNETEVDAWISNNGGATVFGCSAVTWEWEILDYQLNTYTIPDDTNLVCTIQFTATDSNENDIQSTAFLTYQAFPSAGLDQGTGDVSCDITSYDLNQIASSDYNSSLFSSSNIAISQTGGSPGATSSGTVVDFPDTGAGQFTYYFDVLVNTPITIGAVNLDIQSTAPITVRDIIIPFNPGPNITVQVCDFSNVNLLDLYNQLQIELDVDTSEFNEAGDFGYVFEPENFWYNETDDLEANPNTPPLTEITQPGVYQFNAKKFLEACAGEPVFVTLIEGPYQLQAKVYLQGAALNPFVGEETLMRDDLRLQGLIPTVSPYGDGLTCDPSVFLTTGPNAIVDWIWVEFRDQTDNTIVLQGQSAILQRDGDIVSVDGSSPLAVNAAAINAYLVVNHRNHLGVMTANPLTLDCSAPTLVDFTNEKTLTFGTDAQLLSTSGKMVLWAGDANGDGVMRYLGAGNDTNGIKDDVLAPENGNTTSSNFYPYLGYENSDIDMNGQIRYLGPGNDSNFLKDIILIFPTNTGQSNFFPINEQIPD